MQLTKGFTRGGERAATIHLAGWLDGIRLHRASSHPGEPPWHTLATHHPPS